MDRNTIDRIVSRLGVVVAVVLVAVGALMLWGSIYVDGQVRDQLSQQRIFFPPEGSQSIQGPEFAQVRQYAGQQLTTGEQARAYADHYILVHLRDVADGKTYADVSSEAFQDPDNAALKEQADTLFRGTTLRAMLLNAAAFAQIGAIASMGAIVSFVGAAALAVLALLGFRHARSVERCLERAREEARQAAQEDIPRAA